MNFLRPVEVILDQIVDKLKVQASVFQHIKEKLDLDSDDLETVNILLERLDNAIASLEPDPCP